MDLRLRQVIDGLTVPEHKSLLKETTAHKCIPEVPDLRFKVPTWVRAKGMASVFGCLVELVVRSLFTKYVPTESVDPMGDILKWTNSHNILSQLYKEFSRQLPKPIVVCENMKKAIPHLKCLVKRLVRKSKAQKVLTDVEYRIAETKLYGHPDFVIDVRDGSVIPVEMKTTQRWKEMAVHSLIQLHAYVMMAKLHGMTVKRACIFLPLQKKFYMFKVKKWDYSNFLLKLSGFVSETRQKMMNMLMARMMPPIDLRGVGTHIGKGESIFKSLKDVYSKIDLNIPSQIFLASPMAMTQLKITETDIKQTADFIEKLKIRVYIHGPYYINFCNPYNAKSKEKGETSPWALDRLVQELNLSVRMNMLGVVVHSGKSLTMGKEEGYRVMYQSIEYVLNNSDPKSVLIFETAAGQGTELATEPEEIIKLYHTFNKSHPNRMEICVDTCHVFAAGYDPFEFTQQLLESNVKIRLIHFNGSKCDKGCRKDRHMFVNNPAQKIPTDSLQRVLDTARRLDIPCVLE